MKVLVTQLCLTLCDPMTVALQAPVSVGFSRQEYCNGLPFPSPGDLPIPGIEPGSPTLQVDSLQSEPPGKPLVFPSRLAHNSKNSNRGELGAVTEVIASRQ